MKLIPMTDFVLEQHEQCISSNGRTYNYAKFLKQPLTLGMFVPCDLEGNVLEEYHDLENKNILYEDAKKRVLIKGFIHDEYDQVVNNGFELFVETGHFSVENHNGAGYGIAKTIDDLVGNDFELTQNAVNLIFG